jgi:hypothetical protein
MIDPLSGLPTGGLYWLCGCVFKPCNGKPCEQITDYISQLWNYYRQTELDFMKLYTNTIQGPRSDIMKKLTYSRNLMSTSSFNTYNADSRILNCTRVEDEQISPVNEARMVFENQVFPGYCYGIKLGTYLKKTTPLTDNWFHCEVYATNAAAGS